jgi:hypothetical protein
MPDQRFDPSKAVTFDLAEGLVRREGAARQAELVVPSDALLALAEAAGNEATAAFGRAAGGAMGRRVAGRLGGAAGSASVEVVIEHLAAELALAGLGALSLERWGKAAVLVVEGCPLGAAGDRLVEALLAGAIEEALGRSVNAPRLARDGARARFLLAGPEGAERVRSWSAEGVPWTEALVRLHAPSAARVRGET